MSKAKRQIKRLPEDKISMVEDNIALSIYTGNKWAGKLHSIDHSDIFSSCHLGLVKSCIYFDDSRNAKFATFATKVMDNEVKMLLRKTEKHKGVYPISTINISDESNKDPNIDERFDILGGKNEDRYDFITNEHVKMLIEKLSDLEKKIIIYRYFEDESQKDIAEKLSLSQSYVSRVEHRALKKMKCQSEIILK